MTLDALGMELSLVVSISHHHLHVLTFLILLSRLLSLTIIIHKDKLVWSIVRTTMGSLFVITAHLLALTVSHSHSIAAYVLRLLLLSEVEE